MSRQMKWILSFIGAILLIVVAWPWIGVGPHDAYYSAGSSVTDLANHPIYRDYEFGENDRCVDFGVQPMWIPTCMITCVMKHDAILKEELNELGFSIRFHSFLKGFDANFFLKRGDLEAVVGGDMPALTAINDIEAVVTSLMQYGFCSIVAKKHMLIKELRRKRIGYALGSNAHYALLQTLASAGLTEDEVDLLRLDVNEMPSALDKGWIDAFCAWEPTPTIATTKFKGQVIIHRSLTSGYIYFSPSFARRYPEVVRQIVAAELRAIAWLKLKTENTLKASMWSLESASNLIGPGHQLQPEQYVALAGDDLLGIYSTVAISKNDFTRDGRFYGEFLFLRNLGMIPETAEWERLLPSLDNSFLEEILSSPMEYRIDAYRHVEDGRIDSG